MLIIRNIAVYHPEFLGVKDVCICGEKIEFIETHLDISHPKCEEIDGTGKILIPGLIDQHVHLIGGGGEGSFHTRAPRVELSELIESGITTVVGLLGTDGITRDVETLLAHAKALQEEGVTTYICTGHYGYPSATITGDVQKDIAFIQEVLGLKLAISDHRAPNVSLQDLIRMGSDTRVAGMISGKPGFVALHMGDDAAGLMPVFDALDQTSIPIKIFRPTHVNRNPLLLEQGMEYLKRGGYVDYTCGIAKDAEPAKCIQEVLERELPADRVTISSDGHGSWSNYDSQGNVIEMGVSSLSSIFKELKKMVLEYGMDLDKALPFVTSNVAKALEIYPKKGCIYAGADADVLILDQKLNLETVIARGKVMMKDGVLLKKGTYE